jgi:RNA polymerase sigma-70 factor (ECF subfamily)
MAEPTFDSNPTQDLVARLSRGDDAASAALIQHSKQRLESLARHMLHGYPALRRWVETDDVLQNSLIRLMRALGSVQVESPRHFMSLSALQIRRELVDLARHYFGPAGLAAHHESHAGGASNGRENVDVADLSHEPTALAQWCELHEQIGSLPDHQREVMDLLYYDGLSQAESANILSVSVRTVQRRWHSALQLLHERVGDQWPESS